MTQHERSKVLLPPMAMHAETTPCVVRGEGCYLYTEDGRKILDMASGIATNALGHCHPKVIAAAEKQLHTLIHAGHNILYYEPYTTLMEKLVEKTGNKYKVYFSNSGAEANEGAMKLAKYATQRPVIISMKNAFHGRTMATATITTSNAAYRKNYEPMMPSVYFAEYPYLFRTPYKMEDGKCPKEYFTQFDEIFKKIVDPSMVAAIMMEPVQGEGGVFPATDEFIQGIRKFCDEKGILMLLDEVQAGWGRCGDFMCYMTYGIKPDVVSMAKAMGGGMPIGGIACTDRVATAFGPGTHGSTYAGHPVSCAASLAVLRELKAGKWPENAKKVGDYFAAELAKMPHVVTVRHRGLFVGVVLEDGINAVEVKRHCIKNHFLVTAIGANIIRMVPPLTIREVDCDEAVARLSKSINEVAEGK